MAIKNLFQAFPDRGEEIQSLYDQGLPEPQIKEKIALDYLIKKSEDGTLDRPEFKDMGDALVKYLETGEGSPYSLVDDLYNKTINPDGSILGSEKARLNPYKMDDVVNMRRSQAASKLGDIDNTTGSQFGRGLTSFAYGLKGSLANAVSMVANAADLDGIEKWADEKAQEAEEGTLRNKGNTAFKDIDGVGSFGAWALHAVPNGLADIGTMVSGGVTVKVLARGLGLAKTSGSAEKIAGLATLAYNQARMTGEAYGNIKSATGEKDTETALGAGLVMGWLETVFPNQFWANASDDLKKNMLASATKRFAEGFVSEGATEFTQEAVNDLAVQIVDENKKAITKENLLKWVESGVAGGLSGGPIKVMGGLFNEKPKEQAPNSTGGAQPNATTPQPNLGTALQTFDANGNPVDPRDFVPVQEAKFKNSAKAGRDWRWKDANDFLETATLDELNGALNGAFEFQPHEQGRQIIQNRINELRQNGAGKNKIEEQTTAPTENQKALTQGPTTIQIEQNGTRTVSDLRLTPDEVKAQAEQEAKDQQAKTEQQASADKAKATQDAMMANLEGTKEQAKKWYNSVIQRKKAEGEASAQEDIDAFVSMAETRITQAENPAMVLDEIASSMPKPGTAQQAKQLNDLGMMAWNTAKALSIKGGALAKANVGQAPEESRYEKKLKKMDGHKNFIANELRFVKGQPTTVESLDRELQLETRIKKVEAQIERHKIQNKKTDPPQDGGEQPSKGPDVTPTNAGSGMQSPVVEISNEISQPAPAQEMDNTEALSSGENDDILDLDELMTKDENSSQNKIEKSPSGKKNYTSLTNRELKEEIDSRKILLPNKEWSTPRAIKALQDYDKGQAPLTNNDLNILNDIEKAIKSGEKMNRTKFVSMAKKHGFDIYAKSNEDVVSWIASLDEKQKKENKQQIAIDNINNLIDSKRRYELDNGAEFEPGEKDAYDLASQYQKDLEKAIKNEDNDAINSIIVAISLGLKHINPNESTTGGSRKDDAPKGAPSATNEKIALEIMRKGILADKDSLKRFEAQKNGSLDYPEKMGDTHEKWASRMAETMLGRLKLAHSDGDTRKLKATIHSGNKISRKSFEALTGVNLGKTNNDMEAAINAAYPEGAKKEAEQRAKVEADKQAKEDLANKAKQDADQAIIDDHQGFGAEMPKLKMGQYYMALRTKFRYSGTVRTRKEQVEYAVKNGGFVKKIRTYANSKDSTIVEREVLATDPSGDSYSSDESKAFIAYAKHLISKRDAEGKEKAQPEAEPSPTEAPTSSKDDSAKEVIPPDGWETNLTKARVYAEDLINAGRIKGSDITAKTWFSLDLLVPTIKNSLSAKAPEENPATPKKFEDMSEEELDKELENRGIKSPLNHKRGKVFTLNQFEKTHKGQSGESVPANKPGLLADIEKAIKSGEKMDRRKLNELAKKNGFNKEDAIIAEEAYELAMVKAIRGAIMSESNSDVQWGLIRTIHENQPNLSTRTEKTLRLQQYSTPIPMGWIMAKFTGMDQLDPDDKVFEITGGNGMLVAFANNLQENIHVNELDSARLSQLKQAGFNPTSNDATNFDADMGLEKKSAKVVVGNPPFGKTNVKKFDGFEFSMLEHQIMAHALRYMADDGRAGFIIGGSNFKDNITGTPKDDLKDSDRVFFNWLYSNYNVVANIDMDGEMYKAQGTTFPTRMILIDGRKKSDKKYPKQDDKTLMEVETFEGLRNALDSVMEMEKDTEQKRPEDYVENEDNVFDNSQSRQDALDEKIKNLLGGEEEIEEGPKESKAQAEKKPKAETKKASNPKGKKSNKSSKPKIQSNKGEAPKTPSFNEKLLAREQELKDKINAKLGRVYSNPFFDAELFADMIQLGAIKVMQGYRKFHEWARSMAKDLGPKSKPFLKSAFDTVMEMEKSGSTEFNPEIQALLFEKIGGMVESGMVKREDVMAKIVSMYGKKISPMFGPVWAGVQNVPKKAEIYIAPENVQVVKGDGLQVIYNPKSKNKPGGNLTPKNMSKPIYDALENLEERVGNVDDFVSSELFYKDNKDLYKALSAEQIDAVGLIIYNFSQDKSMIIGDQTGTGKGRIAASIIRYANFNDTLPIFVTEKPNLFSDLYRDLKNIGHDINPYILQSSNIANIVDEENNVIFKRNATEKTNLAISEQGKKWLKDNGYDVVLTTYSQFSNNPSSSHQGMALRAIADGSIVILDEAHNAGGESTTGMFFKHSVLGKEVEQPQEDDLSGRRRPEGDADFEVRRAKNVVYLSATYAKRPDNMGLYFRTSLGSAVNNLSELDRILADGGTPVQSLIAANLSKSGEMIRRESSFEGIEFQTNIIKEGREYHAKIADAISGSLRDVIDFDKFKNELLAVLSQDGYFDEFGDNGAGVNNTEKSVEQTEFSAVVHNFISQMLLAIKAKPVAESAIKRIKGGEKVLIYLTNTMESFIKEYSETYGINDGDEINMRFNDVLKMALRRTLSIRVKDPSKEKGTMRILLNIGDGAGQGQNIFANPAFDGIKDAYESTLEKIESMDLNDLPASPIDYIAHIISKGTGQNVLEITGRSTIIDYSTKIPTVRTREGADKDRNTAIFKFNNMTDHNAIIYNRSGATGVSMHSSVDFADQRKRHMFVIQPDLDINVAMQALGRSNRKGQVVKPSYSQEVLDIPAEKRPAAIYIHKMKSLSANISANDESAVAISGMADMYNAYGNEVTKKVILDDEEFNFAKLELTADSPSDKVYSKTTGKAALYPIAKQEEFFDILESEYRNHIEYLDSIGENRLRAKDLDLQAKTVKKDSIPIKRKHGYSQSPFTEEAYLEEVKVRILKKPYNKAKIDDLIQKYDGVNIEQLFEELRVKFNDEYAVIKKDMDEKVLKKDEFAKKVAEMENPNKLDMAKIATLERVAKDATDQVTRLATKYQRILLALKGLRIGQGYQIELAATGGDKTRSILIDFKANLKEGRKVNLSSFSATFAVPEYSQKITISLSSLTSLTATKFAKSDYVYAQWNSFINDDTHENRIVITGNIISGMEAIKAKGEVATFTRDNGEVDIGYFLKPGTNMSSASAIPVDYKTFLAELKNQISKGNIPNYFDHNAYNNEYKTSMSNGLVIRTSNPLMYVHANTELDNAWLVISGALRKNTASLESFLPKNDRTGTYFMTDRTYGNSSMVSFKVGFNKLMQALADRNVLFNMPIIKDEQRLSDVPENTEVHNNIDASEFVNELNQLKREMKGAGKNKIHFAKAPEGNKTTRAMANKTKGEIVIFTDNITPDQLKELLVHEDFVHLVLEGMLGSEAYNQLLKMVMEEAKTPGTKMSFILQKLENNPKYAGMSEQAKADEVLAHWYQTEYKKAEKSSSFKNFMHKIVGWVRRKFGMKHGNLKEIEAIMHESFKKYLEGDNGGPKGGNKSSTSKMEESDTEIDQAETRYSEGNVNTEAEEAYNAAMSSKSFVDHLPNFIRKVLTPNTSKNIGDLGITAKHMTTMSFKAKTWEMAKDWLKIARERVNFRVDLLSSLQEKSIPYAKLKDKKKVDEFLILGDEEGERYPPKELSSAGFSQEEIDAYEGIRSMFDEVRDLLVIDVKTELAKLKALYDEAQYNAYIDGLAEKMVLERAKNIGSMVDAINKEIFKAQEQIVKFSSNLENKKLEPDQRWIVAEALSNQQMILESLYKKRIDMAKQKLSDIDAKIKTIKADLKKTENNYQRGKAVEKEIFDKEEYIKGLENNKGYFPRVRDKGIHVLYTDKSGQKYREVFEDNKGDKGEPAMMALLAKLKADGYYNSDKADKMISDLADQLKAGAITEKDFKLQKLAIRSKQFEVDKVGELPEQLFGTKGSESSLTMMNQAMIDAGMSENARDVANQAIKVIFYSRGWRKHMIRRNDAIVKGYQEENLNEVINSFMQGFAGITSKADAARKFYALLQNVEAKKFPELYNELVEATKDQLRNSDKADRISAKLNNIIYHAYLGFRVGSALVNTTQNFILGVPTLSKAMRNAGKKANEAKLIATFANAMKDGGSYILAKSLGKDSAMGISKEEFQFLNHEYNRVKKNDLTGEMSEAMIPKNGFSKALGKLASASSFMFGMTERLNRTAALLAYYRNMNDVIAEDKLSEGAEDFVSDVHFDYDRMNHLPVFRNSTMRMMKPLVFGLASYNQFLYESMWNMVKNDKRGLVTMMVMLSLLSGVPLEELWEKLMIKFGSTHMRKYFGDNKGTDFAQMGLPGLAGIDLSGSLSLNPPPQVEVLLKALGIEDYNQGPFQQFVANLVATINGDKTIEKTFPILAGRSLIAAYSEYTEGLKTSSGKNISLDDERVMLTGSEALARAAGVRTTRTTALMERHYKDAEVVKMWTKKRSRLMRGFIDAKEDRKDEALKEIQEFNTSLIEVKQEYGKSFNLSPITASGIRQKMKDYRISSYAD